MEKMNNVTYNQRDGDKDRGEGLYKVKKTT